MRKKINSSLILATLLLIILVFSLTGCGLWSTPLKSISFGDLTELTIGVGEEYQLVPTVTPSTAGSSVKFSSSNKAVATVSESGLLKGISGGQTVVRAENVLGTIGSEITVKVVYETIPEGGLVLTAENAQQYFGSEIESVNFSLSWGSVHVPENATIEWFRKEK
ncbi:MAG TPA: Ig-like domain-containing protein, partial [Clostridia bacterium]|nr:Ig-like domain-containing protein [Clostridia bacterium]